MKCIPLWFESKIYFQICSIRPKEVLFLPTVSLESGNWGLNVPCLFSPETQGRTLAKWESLSEKTHVLLPLPEAAAVLGCSGGCSWCLPNGSGGKEASTTCCLWGWAWAWSLLSHWGPLPLRLNHSADGYPLKQGKDPSAGSGGGAAEPQAHGRGGDIRAHSQGEDFRNQHGWSPNLDKAAKVEKRTVKILFESQRKSFCLLLREREFSWKKSSVTAYQRGQEATAQGKSCPQCWEDPTGYWASSLCNQKPRNNGWNHSAPSKLKPSVSPGQALPRPVSVSPLGALSTIWPFLKNTVPPPPQHKKSNLPTSGILPLK